MADVCSLFGRISKSAVAPRGDSRWRSDYYLVSRSHARRTRDRWSSGGPAEEMDPGEAGG